MNSSNYYVDIKAECWLRLSVKSKDEFDKLVYLLKIKDKEGLNYGDIEVIRESIIVIPPEENSYESTIIAYDDEEEIWENW